MRTLISLIFFTFVISISAQKKDMGYSGPLDFSENSKPFIQIDYGISIVRHKKLPIEFNKPGIAEIKLGYSKLTEHKSKTIMEMQDNFLFAGNQSNDLNFETINNLHFKSEGWRFGMGFKDALGYRIKKFYILPYTQMSFLWSNTKLTVPNIVEYISDLQLKKQIIETAERYEGSFHFGTMFEGGVELRFGSLFSLIGSYEGTVIFPRHLFWKQTGSFFIEGMGIVAIDYFVEEISNSSPAAGPIVNFILKNGFSYAYYQLKRNKMNWPFESETPLTYEAVKIGLKFTF